MPDQMLADAGSMNGSPQTLFIAPDAPNSLPMHFQVQDPNAYAPLMTGPQLDPNSPDLFKSNIELAQQHVARIQQMSQNIISSIERAYQPNGNHAMQASSDIISLKHMLDSFADFLRETGVGSLPLLPPDPTAMPAEQHMIEDMTKTVQQLFERRQKMQDNAASVASLLSTERL